MVRPYALSNNYVYQPTQEAGDVGLRNEAQTIGIT